MKEERFSSGTLLKNKISNFGAISPLYSNFIYHSLSLSTWRKQKSRKDIYIRGLSNYYMFWHFESVYNCSKGIHVFYVTMWSMLLLHASLSASIRLMLSCLELSS